MKPIAAFALGLGIGAAACAGAWAWQWRTAARTFERIMAAQGDGMLLLGRQAAIALRAESPEVVRDFANYIVDSSVIRARVGHTSGAYDAVARTWIAEIPAERRALSPHALPLYVIVRQQVSPE